MSISIPAETPSSLPVPPTPQQVSSLADSLEQGFKSAKASAKAFKLQALKARLDAMRLAPIPATPRGALAVAAEAARLSREIGNLAGGPEADPALTAEAAEAAQSARVVIAKARRAVKPGSRQDQLLQRLDTGLAAASPASLDIQV